MDKIITSFVGLDVHSGWSIGAEIAWVYAQQHDLANAEFFLATNPDAVGIDGALIDEAALIAAAAARGRVAISASIFLLGLLAADHVRTCGAARRRRYSSRGRRALAQFRLLPHSRRRL